MQKITWLLLGCLLGSPLAAQGARGISVTQAWARPTPPTATVGVVYLAVANTAAEADQLVMLSTPAAARVEVHETKTVQGMLQMRPLETLDCPPGKTVKSEPNGVHIMLIKLTQPLLQGARFPLTLSFKHAGSVTVQVAVENRE